MSFFFFVKWINYTLIIINLLAIISGILMGCQVVPYDGNFNFNSIRIIRQGDKKEIH